MFAFTFIVPILMGVLGQFIAPAMLHQCLFMLTYLGIYLKVVSNDREKVQCVLKSIEKNARSTFGKVEKGTSRPHGAYFGRVGGRVFMGYVTSESGGTRDGAHTEVIYIVACKSALDMLLCSDKIAADNDGRRTSSSGDSATEERALTIYDREGCFQYLYYSSRRLQVTRVAEPRPQQKVIVDDIVKKFNARMGHHTSYIYGKPGSGKTTIALLVAMATNGTFCKTFNPTDPGDTLINLYNIVEPTREKPLVLLLDEVDTIVRAIHAGVDQHPKVPIMVRDKATFNCFLDDLNQIWDNVIVVMTSNTSKEDIDALDPSYLRAGRVDDCYTCGVDV